MKLFLRSLFLVLFILVIDISPQVENVPLDHPVYSFFKEMKVKNVIPYYYEDLPNLSRHQVKSYLQQIEEKLSGLSSTEKSLFDRYKIEFYEVLNKETTTYLFNSENDFGTNLSEAFSNKVKYFYAYAEENANAFIEFIGHYYYGQQFEPSVNNAHLFDGGFGFRGTVFKHLGYKFSFLKGGSAGNREVAELIEPKLLQNYKWVENMENLGNYDFTEGYLKYHTEPAEEMNLSVQIGREFKTVGYGYGSKLMLSGYGPPLDFIQFNFDYGIAHFTSIHGSTVGEYSSNHTERYTKYWAYNRFKLSFDKYFDIGIGESVVYSGRGIDLAYLVPLGFYKFVEHSIQDRDNGNLYFDLQTSFINNLELQATFLLDENILNNLQDFDTYKNKTAYQLGMFWYEALTLNNLSMIIEYTKIRPYVYSHVDVKNTYSGWGVNLGHPVGPNADEILSRLSYNFNDWMRLTIDYRYIRSGENIYDDSGDLIKNVGGDIYLSHESPPEDENAIFLDGIRINNQIVNLNLRLEPIRDFIFEVIYNYNHQDNISEAVVHNQSYGEIRFTLNY
ncbi:MAG: capsule assembly Wzi family protein [Ignavibacteriales bacterium]